MRSRFIDQEKHRLSESPVENYNGIDLVKFFCSILVFMLHIPLIQGETSEVGKIINFGLQHYLCRLAVPFFFVSSGFFLFRKMPAGKPDTEMVKSYCFKLLRLLGLWYVLTFTGGKTHLWYLGGTVVAVVLLCLCLRSRIRFRYICLLALVIYLIGLLGDSYYGMVAPVVNSSFLRYLFKGYNTIFVTTRNGVFMGFVFVAMGAAFAWHKIQMRPLPAFIGFGISLLFLFVEVFWLKTHNASVDYNMYICLLPATYFLFAFAAGLRLKDRSIYRQLRNVSILIYFTHKLIGKFVSWGIILIQKISGIEMQAWHFGISLVATMLITFGIQWLSHKERFRWLNWLIA